MGPGCMIMKHSTTIAVRSIGPQHINQSLIVSALNLLIDKQYRLLHIGQQDGPVLSKSGYSSREPSKDICQSNKIWNRQRVMKCHLCCRQKLALYKINHRNFSIKSNDFINPIDRLQAFVDVPILPPENHLFQPSQQEVQTAGGFWTQSMKEMKFLKSAKFQEQLPEDNLPEVTFIGRSNVGKSTLIQALLQASDVLVKTSKTPGHTRLLNFFEITDHFRLVDVPGYGYRMPDDYSQMVETFLKTRPSLKKTFVLIDGARGFKGSDVDKCNLLEEWQISYSFVITKIDKVSTSVLLRNLLEIQKVMSKAKFCFPQPFLVSGVTGEGIQLLQTFITYVTGNMAIEGM